MREVEEAAMGETRMEAEKAVMSNPQQEDPGNGGSWLGSWPETTREFEDLIEAFQDRLVWFAYRCVFRSIRSVVPESFDQGFRSDSITSPPAARRRSERSDAGFSSS